MRSLLTLILAAAPAFAQDIIAKTEPKTPAEELKSFKVPAGFEVQLVAAEPDIDKPIQIAWDSAGRLWVTTTRHYPFPAEKGKATDKLMILSDFDAGGRAKKVETFYAGLNIPIGILPLPDGKSCLVSEVGRILKLTDTKGVGKADLVEELFTGFGTEDTHGMTNSFLYMPDGWVYATHGFKNTSKVKAKDGSEITMNSGNTYRFKPDGSRIEIVTRGQVNPFGLCCDPYLNLYTADCHSKPITQLIRGATYQSFAKPHDGLGFAPHVTNHSHGSTALCGLEWYSDTKFPKEYRDCLYLGNVVTNRINADRITFKGSTPVAEELPDFLTSSDPWFRPTDIKLGMDGALYFADFYNRIIGHYEVDLKHPQRDKDRGRIWRIVTKSEAVLAAKPPEDLKKAKLSELYLLLAESNITAKLLAFHELTRRYRDNPKLKFGDDGGNVNKPLREMTTLIGLIASLGERSGVEALAEFPKMFEMESQFAKLAKQEPENFSGGLIRAFASKKDWNDNDRKRVIQVLEDFPKSPWIHRAAIDGIVLHPHADFVQPLLKFIPTIPAEDTHLLFAARVALRDCLRDEEKWKLLEANDLLEKPILIEMALAVPNRSSMKVLSEAFWKKGFPKELRISAAEAVGRYGDQKEWDAVADTEVVDRWEYLIVTQSLMKGMLAGVPWTWYAKNETKPAAIFSLKTRIANDVEMSLGSDVMFRDNMRAGKLYLQLAPTGNDWGREKLQGAALDCLANPIYTEPTRIEAIDVASINPTKEIVDRFRKMVQDEKLPSNERARLMLPLLKSATTSDAVAAKDLIKHVSYSSAILLAVGLASEPFGADLLLLAVKNSEAPARLLQEKAVLDRLKATKVNNLDARVKELTAGIPSAEKRLDDIIKKRALAFPKVKADAVKGKAVFAKNCAACHTLENVGAKVGPQLDGVGVRGLERLLEDTLDPNRNVDAAFRATKFDLLDGKTIVGLLLREEGAVYVVSDALGKEVRLPKADVDKKTVILQSAMPSNVDTLVPEKDYYDLLAYLLMQKPK